MTETAHLLDGVSVQPFTPKTHDETPEEVARHDPSSLYHICRSCPPKRHCCFRAATIVVLPEEAVRIVARTGAPDLLNREDDGLYTIKKVQGLACPFLTPDRLCGIYDIRPTDCHSWPLTMDKSANPHGNYLVDADCPAADNAHLEKKFCKAARRSLEHIPANLRQTFVKLVYRDFHILPLQPYQDKHE
jgi:Fe-S-cluster containining protein